MPSGSFRSSIEICARQFGWFRIMLGGYLIVHFLQLLPHAGELFGGTGILPNADANLIPKILPNPLWDASGPHMAIALVLLGAISGIAIILGRGRRFWCTVAWLVWAWLFARNNLTLNPSMPYIGLILMVMATIPAGEAFVVGKKPDPNWAFPSMAWWAIWIALAAGYTFSGIMKLGSPSWVDGSALRDVLNNPLARDNAARHLFLALPLAISNAATWLALVLEILFLPLALFRPTRVFVWSSMLVMHLGILVLINFADLTLGMILAHAFTWRPHWIHLGCHTTHAELGSTAALDPPPGELEEPRVAPASN